MRHYLNDEYILKRFKISKERKRKKRIFSLIVLIIFIIFFFITYCIKIVNPIIYQFSIAEAEKLLAKASNSAIEKTFINYNYNDLISINYDKDGNISLIQANQVVINKLINSVSNLTQTNIDNVSLLGIKIPIGTCSGIGFLSGKGSNIKININPIGNIFAFFKSEFKEAGINQTIHKIYLSVNSAISIILPFDFKRVEKNIEVLISESLIVGKIPNFYLNIPNLQNF